MTTHRAVPKFSPSDLVLVGAAFLLGGVGCSDDAANSTTPAAAATLTRVEATFVGVSRDTLTIAVGTSTCESTLSSPGQTRARTLSADLCKRVSAVFGTAEAFASVASVPACGGAGDDVSLRLRSTAKDVAGAIGACVGASREPYLTFFDVLTRAREETLR